MYSDANEPAVVLCILAAGVFFLTGLLTGIWKYRRTIASERGRSPYYVDIAHRSSLLYSFAALLLAEFAARSAWPDALNFISAFAALLFFALAIVSYIVHGVLGDTNNQLRAPFVLGPYRVPRRIIVAAMWALIVAEVGGTLILFAGVIAGL